jgi:hypothetical protein
MQLWIASFVILFALSQLLDWLRGIELSLPILALGGLCLAIASNYDKRRCFPFWPISPPAPPSHGTTLGLKPVTAPAAIAPASPHNTGVAASASVANASPGETLATTQASAQHLNQAP